jgi:hypothetical protein
LRTRPIEGFQRLSTSKKSGDKFRWVLSKQSAPPSSERESNSLTKTGAGKVFGFESRGVQGENSFAVYLSDYTFGVPTRGNKRIFSGWRTHAHSQVSGAADPALGGPDDPSGAASWQCQLT